MEVTYHGERFFVPNAEVMTQTIIERWISIYSALRVVQVTLAEHIRLWEELIEIERWVREDLDVVVNEMAFAAARAVYNDDSVTERNLGAKLILALGQDATVYDINAALIYHKYLVRHNGQWPPAPVAPTELRLVD